MTQQIDEPLFDAFIVNIRYEFCSLKNSYAMNVVVLSTFSQLLDVDKMTQLAQVTSVVRLWRSEHDNDLKQISDSADWFADQVRTATPIRAHVFCVI
jgi:hypothetical protein